MSKDGADIVHFFHDKSRPNQKILFQRGDEIKSLVRTNRDVRRQFAKTVHSEYTKSKGYGCVTDM